MGRQLGILAAVATIVAAAALAAWLIRSVYATGYIYALCGQFWRFCK